MNTNYNFEDIYSLLSQDELISFIQKGLEKVIEPLYNGGIESVNLVISEDSLPKDVLFFIVSKYSKQISRYKPDYQIYNIIEDIDLKIHPISPWEEVKTWDPNSTPEELESYKPNFDIERCLIWGCIYFTLYLKESKRNVYKEYISDKCNNYLDNQELFDYFIEEANEYFSNFIVVEKGSKNIIGKYIELLKKADDRVAEAESKCSKFYNTLGNIDDLKDKNAELKTLNDELNKKITQLESDINAQTPNKYKLTEGKKTDFIKIISAMYDLRLFSTPDGRIANNKQKLFDELGKFFNENFKDYSKALSQAKQQNNFLNVFDDLKTKADDYYKKESKINK